MTVKLNTDAITVSTLQKAILFYGSSNNRHETFIYATVHEVEESMKGQPVIRAGQPIDRASLIKLSRDLLKGANNQPLDILPANVLSVGQDFLLWWKPPGLSSIFFDSDTVGKRSGVVHQPGLIFAVHGKTCYVFAVKGNERPAGDTVIYRSPYFNVWESGKICTGNVKLPNAAVSTKIREWEQAFFHSNFTHSNAGKLVNYKGGAPKLWQDLLDGKRKKFPEHALIQLHLVPTKKNTSNITSKGKKADVLSQDFTVARLLALFEDMSHA